MADVIQYQHSVSATLYAVIRNADGQAWNGSAFENYQTANFGTYDIAMTEQGTASRFYTAAVPALAAGLYQVLIYQQAGGSPAETDPVVGSGEDEWDGTRWTRLGAPAGASLAADLLAIDNLVDDLESRVGTPSNLGGGATLAANLADIEAQTDDIGVAGAGLTAVGDTAGTTTLLSRLTSTRSGYLDNLSAGAVATAAKLLSYFQSALRKDVTVDSDIGGAYDDATDSQEAIRDRGDAAWTTATGFSTLDASGVRSAVGLASANLDTQIGDLPTNAELATALAAADDATLSAIAALNDFSLDDTIGDGTITVKQALRILVAGMAGKLSGAATTSIAIRDLADTKDVIAATVDSDGNRSAVTVTP